MRADSLMLESRTEEPRMNLHLLQWGLIDHVGEVQTQTRAKYFVIDRKT